MGTGPSGKLDGSFIYGMATSGPGARLNDISQSGSEPPVLADDV